jgi:hypothetical protein
MRKVSSSLLAALVVVALFWGNCLSCPQFLLAAKAAGASHECCKRNHQSPQPTKTKCETQGLRNFVQNERGQAAIGPLAVPNQTAVEIPAPLHPLDPAPASLVWSPPDLLALHSSFRI